MTVYPFLRIVVVAGLLGSAACGDDEPYETIGDAIRGIASAWCDRAIECSVAREDERDLCEAAFTGEACDLGDCSQEFEGEADRVDACIAALDDYGCAGISEALPAECQSF
jgi:hypothetical protein